MKSNSERTNFRSSRLETAQMITSKSPTRKTHKPVSGPAPANPNPMSSTPKTAIPFIKYLPIALFMCFTLHTATYSFFSFDTNATISCTIATQSQVMPIRMFLLQKCTSDTRNHVMVSTKKLLLGFIYWPSPVLIFIIIPQPSVSVTSNRQRYP